MLLQSTKNDEEDIEIVEETAVKNSFNKEKPLLPPSSKDDDFSAIRRKKPRQKRAVVKWNRRGFVPVPVLNRQDVRAGGKTGERDGFHTYNRLGCKGCKHAFCKTTCFENRKCSGDTSSFPPPSLSYSSASYSSSPCQAPQAMGLRPSTMMTKTLARYTTQEDKDVLEIVGDPELGRRNNEKTDKNFNKASGKTRGKPCRPIELPLRWLTTGRR